MRHRCSSFIGARVISFSLLAVLSSLTWGTRASQLSPSGVEGLQYEGNGKRSLPCLSARYTVVPVEKAALAQALRKGGESLKHAAALELPQLAKRPPWSSQDIGANNGTLRSTLTWLQQGTRDPSVIKGYVLSGEDGCQNVFFTGYYTPVLQIRRQPDKHFRYPLYQRPTIASGVELPTRREIDEGGVLQGRQLELGYSDDLLAVYIAQVQGSVSVHYVDTGEDVTLVYGGKNGHAYQSLGKALISDGKIPTEQISVEAIRRYFAAHPDQLTDYLYRNPSYTFFKPMTSGPFASSGAEVTQMVTAAVDPTVIPHGAVLLAEIPNIDANGQWTGRYDWRLLVAQDRGAAIRGAGRVDIYFGKGLSAEARAAQLKHYGRVFWLVHP